MRPLFAFEDPTGWQYILGDTAGLHRLAMLADLVATRRDTVVSLPLRQSPMPQAFDRMFSPPRLLDLVLAPRHVALRPKEWKVIRSWKPADRRRVVLPPLRRFERYPAPRVPHERLDERGMDRRVASSTLILSGDSATFKGLADTASWISGFNENGTGTHLDRIMRGGDIGLLLKFWSARRVPESEG